MRRRLGIGPETVLLLMVATNLPAQGHRHAAAEPGAAARRRLPVQLVVVGGKRLAPWRRMAARLGVAAAVQFVGPVEDIVPYYAAADLYVHPTIYDTCSLVVLEAAACGLPVVTTRCNGAAELFHDGGDIVLVADPADDEAFAAAVGACWTPAARRRMGDAARQTALAQTFDRNVDNIVALYEEVVEQRARRGRRSPGVDASASRAPDQAGRRPRSRDDPASALVPTQESRR